MADDDYESTDANPTTDVVKFYQVAVPGYRSVADPPLPSGVTMPTNLTASDGTQTSMGTFTGNSFLRIGSSPDPANDYATAPFLNSVKLAKLVGDPGGILAAEGIAVASGSITSTAYDDSNASTLAALGSQSFSDHFQDGAGVQTSTLPEALQTSTYGTHQDSNFLLGFADDVRNRGPIAANALHPAKTLVNNTEQDNTAQNRQVETLRLLTKGGWWDHSDGNRVTTTSGDKIEVIQGNYKLVVLGRQPVPAPPAANATAQELAAYKAAVAAATLNTFITDVSGGHFQEQYPSPTPCIKTIEYVQDEGGEWTLYQDNGIGNLITKLKGRTVDLFQGSKREAYVGSHTGDTDTSLDPELVSKTWAKKIYAQTGSSSKPVGHGRTDTGTSLPDSMPADQDALKDGDVCSATWAKRIMSYTGSSDSKVSYVYSETNAGQIKSRTNADLVWNIALVTGAVGNVTLAGGDVFNVTAAPVVANATAGAMVANVTTGLDLLNLNAVLNLVNLNMGAAIVNIDLAPLSIHCGTLSVEFGAKRALIAGRVDVGFSPDVTAIASGAVTAAKVVAVGAAIVGGVGGVVAGIAAPVTKA